MNRYTHFEYRGLLPGRKRAYKLIYTLSALALVEENLGVEITSLDKVPGTIYSMAAMLHAGLQDSHPDVTIKAAMRMAVARLEEVKAAINKAFAQALPKKEDFDSKELIKASEEAKKDTDSTWEQWERMAFTLGLMPWEVEKLTPREISYLVKAFNDRHKSNLELAAWHVSHVLNMFSKSAITPAMLLGEEDKDDGERTWTDEEFDALWEAREAHREGLEANE